MREVLPIAKRGPLGVSAPGGPVAVRLAVAGAIGTAVFFALLLRLWALTVMSGEEYVNAAQANQLRQLPVEAPRGDILDRNGKPLVTNRAAREVVVRLQDVPEGDRPLLYRRLASTLDMTVSEIESKAERAVIADPLSPIVVSTDVEDDNLVYYLEEHASEFPGVEVRNRWVRSYRWREAAAHLFGQVGEVSKEQLDHEYENLEAGDNVGQSGLEKTYDKYLRGEDGYKAVEVDAAGVQQGYGRGEPAKPGRSLKLTIDLPLQRATERGLREGISIAHTSGEGRNANAGAAVAIDPRTGEVLALASYPGYDPNIFVTPNHDVEIKALLKNKHTPLTNRAIAGLYPPGSTYKVVTGIAAMREGYVKPGDFLPCPASMEVSGQKFKNWFPENLGALNMQHALEVSCDTYFYRLALDFYNMPGSPLQEWSRDYFGLGQPTGIDIPGEEDGLVPDPAWRRKTFDGWERTWSTGHSVNLSIGQGDLLVTPLQMTRIFAAIANGGTVHTPRLAQSVEDSSGHEVVKVPAGPNHKIPMTGEQLDAVRSGLELAATSSVGTAAPVFSSFEIPSAGKTGTAEKPPVGDMAWYCGYAPADNPTIAACAMIEAGGHGGSSAAPVVLRMFQQWFHAEGGTVKPSGRSD